MVTRSSITSSIKSHKTWLDNQHKLPGLNKMVRQTITTFKTGLEIDIRLATLPSLISPMPKNAVDKIQKKIRTKRQL